jgi:hypothetical protein
MHQSNVVFRALFAAVHVGVWVVVVYGSARVRWCAAVYDGARSAVVCGGVRWCMAVYVAKKIILKYSSKEFWQRSLRSKEDYSLSFSLYELGLSPLHHQ